MSGDPARSGDVGLDEPALRQLAEAAARAGGGVAKRYFGGEFDVRLKDDRSEVSDADEAAQVAVLRTLLTARPEDACICEERLHVDDEPPPPPANDRPTWVIDPVDGTRNFIRHVPFYACSVGLMYGGWPVVGAVYNVERDVLYSASVREGLFINERRIERPQVRSHPLGEQRRPVVAIPSNPVTPVAPLAHAWLDRFVCRNFGATALHLALVAHGELDGMLADNPKLWDIAAGYVLVTAVGGTLMRPDGTAIFPLDVGTYAADVLPTIAARAGFAERLHAGGGA